jgi:oligopeptide/dipeptide ABC transporter ATP-binding protein
MPDLVVVDQLKKYFVIGHKGIVRRQPVTLKAVDDVSFVIHERETFGLVGESGSGKSTLAYIIAGMYRPTAGRVLFREHDLIGVGHTRPFRLRKDIQLVFQDPGSSLNPKQNIRQILDLPLSLHRPGLRKLDETARLLDLVGLSSEYMYKYPEMLSGGEKQIVAIARALATNPSLILLDEPTSSLDVSMQSGIISLLVRLQQELSLTFLFITHDLSMIRNVASRVAIMYLGKICEVAKAEEFFTNPQHPYTQMLLSSIPVVTAEEDQAKPKKIRPTGEIPSPVNLPPGCSFHLRCPYATDLCKRVDPVFYHTSDTHAVRCHLFAYSRETGATPGLLRERDA